MEINNFDINDVINQNVLLMGDSAEKRRTCEWLVSFWNKENNTPALVVLDYKGSLYEKYGKNGILADSESIGGVFPDYLLPVLRHPIYGRSLASTIQLLLDASISMKQDKNSNDAFWSQSGKETIRQFLSYLLVLLKDDVRENGLGNTLVRCGKFSGTLRTMMNKLVTLDTSDVAKYINEIDMLLPLRLFLQMEKGTGALPFDGTIHGPGGNRAATYNCILMSAISMADSLFAYMSHLADHREEYESCVPSMDIIKYIKRPAGKALYICGSSNSQINSAIATFALIGIAAAADVAKQSVTVIVNECDRWRIVPVLNTLRTMQPQYMSIIMGYDSMNKLVCQTSENASALFADLGDMADLTIWHGSDDSSEQDTYKRLTLDKDRMYRLSDLGRGLVGIGKNRELKYCIMGEPTEVIQPCTRQRRANDNDCPLWFDQTYFEAERTKVERSLYSGVTRKVFKQLIALGYFAPGDCRNERCIKTALIKCCRQNSSKNTKGKSSKEAATVWRSVIKRFERMSTEELEAIAIPFLDAGVKWDKNKCFDDGDFDCSDAFLI